MGVSEGTDPLILKLFIEIENVNGQLFLSNLALIFKTETSTFFQTVEQLQHNTTKPLKPNLPPHKRLGFLDRLIKSEISRF